MGWVDGLSHEEIKYAFIRFACSVSNRYYFI